MMKLGNILDKMKGSRNPAWLFLSYDLDNSRITAVRRVAQDAPVWADWNQFVKEQVERCFKDISNIPNERVYAFRFDNLESIPYLQGEKAIIPTPSCFNRGNKSGSILRSSIE